MIENKRILALIPARGGSKGIPGKNIIHLCGMPLISYSIKAARKSRYVDDVVVTTDSKEIAEVSKEFGAEVPFLRPASLASDTAKTIDAVLHALNYLKRNGREYDILVLLQPTQPLRQEGDIDRALETYITRGMQDLVSVKKVEEHPILMRTIDGQGRLERLSGQNSTVRRQDMADYYLVDGSIYINDLNKLNQQTSFNDNPIPFLIDTERSVDIDERKDLEFAEFLLKKEKR